MSSTSSPEIEKAAGAADSSASLVAAAPLEALLATLNRDIAYIRDRLPGSGDLATLQRFRDELAQALDDARRADIWLTPKEVADHTGKGLSTVTKECREFGKTAGAVRNGTRSWLIRWPTYEAWMVATGRPKKAA